MTAIPPVVLLIYFGSLALGLALVRWLYSLSTRAARDAPATSPQAFSRQVPDTTPGASQRPRLTANGRVMLLFACPAAVLALLISWATINKLLADRHPPVARPLPVLPALVFDGAFLWLAWKLRRDYQLARNGRLTTAIVVGYGGSQGPARSLVTVFYDFLSGDGVVTRGHSIVSNYTLRSPYYQTAIGAGAQVFYLPDRPERNALRASLAWDPT